MRVSMNRSGTAPAASALTTAAAQAGKGDGTAQGDHCQVTHIDLVTGCQRVIR